MIAFHMFCHEKPGEAARIARAPLERYIKTLVTSATDWIEGTSSADYPGYDKLIEKIKNDTFEANVESGAAWIGTPDEIAAQIRAFGERSGPFEIASLQVNFNDIALELGRPFDEALRGSGDAAVPSGAGLACRGDRG